MIDVVKCVSCSYLLYFITSCFLSLCYVLFLCLLSPVPEFEHRYKRSVDKTKLDDDYSQDSVYNGTVYIEAMVTADITTCNYYGNGTLDYLLNTANLVRNKEIHLLEL